MSTLKETFTNIANAIREKDSSAGTMKPSEMPDKIKNIPTGSGEDKPVVFLDYDGTELYTYSIKEAQSLTKLPEPPDHSDLGITFQEWNYTLEEVKTGLNGNIGATYCSSDDKCYITITFNPTYALIKDIILTLNVGYTGTSIVVDWGDGTIDTKTDTSALTHSYSSFGTYTITISGDNTALDIGKSSYILKSNNSTYVNMNQLITSMILSNKVTSVGDLSDISTCITNLCILPNSVKTIELCNTQVVLPRSITSISTLQDSLSINFVNLASSPDLSYYLDIYKRKMLHITSNITSLKIQQNMYIEYLNVDLPATLTSFSAEYFINYLPSLKMFNNKSVEEITVPSQITSFESDSAFLAVANVETLIFPETLTKVYDSYSIYCKKLIIKGTDVFLGHPHSSTDTFKNLVNGTVIVEHPVNFNGCHLPVGLKILDMSALDTPMETSPESVGYSEKGTTTTYLIKKGTLELYKNDDNWSTIYATGQIKEVE